MMIYKEIKHRYNKNTNELIRKYVKNNKRMANLKTSTTFLIRCRQAGIIPRFISDATVNIYNIFQQDKETEMNLDKILHRHIYNFQLKILKVLIQYKHKQIFKTQKILENLKSVTCDLLNKNDNNILMKSEETIYDNIKKENFKRLNTKMDKLMREHMRKMEINFNEDWLVNKTEKDIPKNVQWLLSLGPKYGLPYKKDEIPIVQCIADGEQCIQTIEEKEKQEISRTKFVTLLENHKSKMRLNGRDIFTLDTIKHTRKFLSDNKDVLILNADKGNKTVVMERNEYDLLMRKILGDMCTYRRIKRDPTYTLQTRNNSLVENLFKLNVIDVNMRNRLVVVMN